MSKKRRGRHKKDIKNHNSTLTIKDLTVGQVIRKNEEVEAGVLPRGQYLRDKYIKQHREEIEADKFETREFKKKS